ncbi:30S ribosomal protein S9 [Persicirhabdus sediminis]|uniref:Small ribosomal subunit protein uS9 n=1 Tax=Persicirhabdus sediminis TaxID=454144 RepID=A0A8J7MFV4_9BACT|nr:30S ribosomal protein S9 [Persicirhabdus sediminis]MBK1792016.1 30S ribosomal protein S9 [Persicirhabdus sediminis]
MSEATILSATGRRKTAVARVWLTEGSGKITINKRNFEDYVGTVTLQNLILEPFQHAKLVNKYDVKVVSSGGGINGQVGAIRLGIARALCQHDPELRGPLKEAGLLRRDPRQKERKKFGQPGARKRFQFSKR